MRYITPTKPAPTSYKYRAHQLHLTGMKFFGQLQYPEIDQELRYQSHGHIFSAKESTGFPRLPSFLDIQPLGFRDGPIYFRRICRGYNLHLPSHCTSIEPAFFAIIAIPRGHGCLEIPEERSITSARREKALRSAKRQPQQVIQDGAPESRG